MAAFTVAIQEYSDQANSRKYTVNGHTVQKPKLVLQKRTVGSVGGASGTDTLSVVYGTEDSAGEPLSGRVVFEANVRRPVEAIAADVTAALADFRNFIASDEFTDLVNTQNYIQ